MFKQMLFLMVGILIPLCVSGQSKYDFPAQKSVDYYECDSAYIAQQIDVLTRIGEKITDKNAVFTEDEQKFINRCRCYSTPKFSKDGKLKLDDRSRKSISEQNSSDIHQYKIFIGRTQSIRYEDQEFEPERVSLYGCGFDDYVPYVKKTKIEPTRMTDWSDSKKEDEKGLSTDFVWLNGDDWEEVTVDRTFPERVYYRYRKYKSHPEYAVFPERIRDKVYSHMVFDAEGKLVYVSCIDLNMDLKSNEQSSSNTGTYIPREAQRLVCVEDFLSNKYNIMSEEEKTLYYIKRELKMTQESNMKYYDLMMEIIGTQLEHKTKVRYSKNVQELIKNKAEQNMATDQLAAKVIGTFMADQPYRDKASAYIRQLEQDHKDDLEEGRRFRNDATSFNVSFNTKEGKAAHIFRIQYVQVAPFVAYPVMFLIEEE